MTSHNTKGKKEKDWKDCKESHLMSFWVQSTHIHSGQKWARYQLIPRKRAVKMVP